MDNSNMGVVITGDIEDQRHNPKWFVDHMHMLRPNQEEEPNKLGFVILKVPEYIRQPPTTFSPKGWRFGLHNRENLDNSGSEAFKLALAVQYGLVGEKWIRFRDAIVGDPKTMLACYGLQDGMTSWTNEQIKHVLALDALFLATYIDIQFPMEERRLWTPHVLPSWSNASNMFSASDKSYSNWVKVRMGVEVKVGVGVESVHIDFHHVENQIPLVLIDRVIDHMSTSPTLEGNESVITNSQYQQSVLEIGVRMVAYSFMDIYGEGFKIEDENSSIGNRHLLGAAYKAICGSEGLLMTSGTRCLYIHVPSAIELKQSGIKLMGYYAPLCKMSYRMCNRQQYLFLPTMEIYESTLSFIQNMAWYENQSISNGCLLHDYILFMSDLIQTPEDLDLLIENLIIYNYCGMKGFEMWKTLKEGLTQIPSSDIHHNMKKAIKSEYRPRRYRRYRLWSEFKIVFCSKPWLVLSTIAVVLVTVATLVQTYIAIIGSNKLKPKFP